MENRLETLREINTSAISKHGDKGAIHDPYDELLKDADVMDHCLYNVDLPIEKMGRCSI